MKNEKICPFHDRNCNDRCGFFDSKCAQCSIISIADSLSDIATNTDGMECYIEDIPDKLYGMNKHLSDIYNAV